MRGVGVSHFIATGESWSYPPAYQIILKMDNFGTFKESHFNMLLFKAVLIFILPALLSINSITTPNTDCSQSLLKYWVVISLSFPLEFISNKWKGVNSDFVKIVFVCWCLSPTEYNGSDIIFDYLLSPIYTAGNDLLYLLARYSIPCFVRCQKVTKDFTGEMKDLAEVCSFRFREVFVILMNATQQLGQLLLSFIVEQEVKPRLFSDIYKDFKKSLYE